MLHLRKWLKGFRRSRKKAPACRTPYRLQIESLEDRTLLSTTGTGLLGQYYTDQTFTHLQASRIDPTINFSWNNQSPISGVASTNFSIKWTGELEGPATGPIEIYTNSDDGVRVYINGTLIINNWTDHSVQQNGGLVNMVAGQMYNIEVDYHENTGPATIQLFWASSTIKWQVIPTSQLYPPTTTTTTTDTPQATAPVTTDWFSQNLHTPAIVSLVRSLDADKTFSRADMLSLFQTVESAGAITSSELTDLKTIVSNATVLGMPAYVQNLASKVVNGDPANADYLGKPLGNLAVGSSAGQLEALVGKWFLGTDHPAVNASGLTYMYTSGSLFGPNGPQYTNVVQGEVNDCYLMAALGATAVNSPQAISSAFIDNGDGTFTVRFYDNGVAQYVTVDRYLPATSAKKLWYAGMGWSVSNTANVLWVPLLEKAFAELAASGWSQPSAAANSYAAIGEGWEGTALTELTGKSASWSAISNTTTSLNSIVSTFQSGHMVMLDSNPKTASNIVSSHIYVMIGYASSTKTFTLYNPWGSQIQLTWAQLEANFGTFTYSV